MPYRNPKVWLVLLGTAGLLLVAGLLVLRVDVRRAARTGPRWKRRLLASALILLGIGTGAAALDGDGGEDEISCYYISVPTQRQSDDVILSPKATTEQNARWNSIVRTWRQAKDVAQREPLTYPMTKARQDELLKRLAEAERGLSRLQAEGVVAEPTAKLLSASLKELTTAARQFRPDPGPNQPPVTCYIPMPLPKPEVDSLTRLTTRVELLEAIVAGGKIQPAVADQVARMIRQDAEQLNNPVYRRRLNDTQQTDAKKLIERVNALLAKLPTTPQKPGPSDIESADGWGRVQALRSIARLYTMKGSTQAQRKQFDKDLERARKQLGSLVRQGYLSAGASRLLDSELDQLHGAVFASPPVDAQVTCYTMPYISPAQQSLERFSQRLPLLQDMLAHGRLRPEVVEALLSQLKADLADLTNEKELTQLKQIDPAAYARAVEMAPKARAAVADLDTSLKHARTPTPTTDKPQDHP